MGEYQPQQPNGCLGCWCRLTLHTLGLGTSFIVDIDSRRTTSNGIAAPTQLCAHSSIISLEKTAVWYARHSPLHFGAESLECIKEFTRAIHF